MWGSSVDTRTGSRLVLAVSPALAAWAVAALVAMLAACGGDDSGPTCGPGTVASGASCVPESEPTVCGAGTQLVDGLCVADQVAPDTVVGPDVPGCVPACAGKTCGDDGCGGSCGTCDDPAAPYCDAVLQVCVSQCVPSCAGKNCGDNGCGGSCGTCDGGSSCESFGRCVPNAWTCAPKDFGNGMVCNCGCGAPDPDCLEAALPIAGCASLEVCGEQGQCTSKAPSTWTCPISAYAANDVCDCGCGAPDPDCASGRLAVVGCEGDAPACNPDGSCKVCVPSCDGKDCGSNGCGGTCGTCPTTGKTACADGVCVDPCSPEPLFCKSNICGEDGCGGSCGSCADGQTCVAGQCVAPDKLPNPNSCVGNCGSLAPGGCSCAPGCATSGTCCSDLDEACTCRPSCTDANGTKACGDDGCGGSCGSCGGNTPYCDGTGRCVATCTPRCEGRSCGDNGCGGQCGTCAAASSCEWTGRCVPDAWFCSPTFYGDNQGCDCGCGAPDPDCDSGAVYNCPAASDTCTTQGLCDVTFCTSNGSCGDRWCVGSYFAGSASYAGVCGDGLPDALPPGAPCSANVDCATSACIGGLCRQYCAEDLECPPAEICVGESVSPAPRGVVTGFAPVCAYVLGTAAACQANSDCAAKERCTAVIDAKTRGPRYVCSEIKPSTPMGTDCAVSECADGMLCVATTSGRKCTLPCSGGDTDCPAGWTCGTAPFHNNGTTTPADDPEVKVCKPR